MEKHLKVIIEYNYDDFLTEKPYEYLYNFKGTAFAREQLLTTLKKRAADVGYKSFTKSNKLYKEAKVLDEKRKSEQNKTQFTGQLLELNCGKWDATDEGPFQTNSTGDRNFACHHPITLNARLEDFDSKTSQFVLGYRMPGKNAPWEEIVADNYDLSTPTGVIKLARYGIDVTSLNASKLVEYLSDLRTLNFDEIPLRYSIKRLGYIEEMGFAPYTDKLVFGATSDLRNMYDSISEKGSYEDWLDIARQCRAESIPAHIMLSASFASPLLAIVGALPFFVHLWSPDGGTGKTVALRLAASVWANPELGKYVQTLNATQVGMEKTAAFLGQLPYCMDELQLSRDQHGKSKIDVYQLAEGVGRTRGTKDGGVEAASRWQCCFLTTGESPITDIKRGSGAVNRVVDVGCSSEKPVLRDAPKVATVISANYGHAGRIFVDRLYECAAISDSVRITFSGFRRDLENANVTGKQAMAAAVILTASQLAAYWIFKDEHQLTVEEILPYLATNETASLGAAAYEFLLGWVAQNKSRFISKDNEPNYDVYGTLETGVASVIRDTLEQALSKAGFAPKAVLRYLKDSGLLFDRGDKGYARKRQIGGASVDCIVFRLRTSQEPNTSGEVD